MKKLNIIYVIPAKGRSIRCPGKNVFLLKYTLEFLKRRGLINKTIISTESKSIKTIAKRYRVEFCHEDLLDDEETSQNYGALNALKFYEEKYKNKVDLVVVLNITAPFMPKDLLNLLIKEAIKTQADLVIPIIKVKDESYLYFQKK